MAGCRPAVVAVHATVKPTCTNRHVLLRRRLVPSALPWPFAGITAMLLQVLAIILNATCVRHTSGLWRTCHSQNAAGSCLQATTRPLAPEDREGLASLRWLLLATKVTYN